MLELIILVFLTSFYVISVDELCYVVSCNVLMRIIVKAYYMYLYIEFTTKINKSFIISSS